MVRLFTFVTCLLILLLAGCGQDGDADTPVHSGPEDAGIGSDTAFDDAASEPADSGAGGSGGTGGQGGAGGSGSACPPDDEFLANVAWTGVLETHCAGCHQIGGMAEHTRMRLEPVEAEGALAANLVTLTRMAQAELDGVSLLLSKASGTHPDGHGDADVLDLAGAPYQILSELAARLRSEVDDCGEPTEDAGELQAGAECESLAPGRRLVRRLSHGEYQNTIRDLLGVEVDAEAAFVADPVEHGFDNNPELLGVQGLLADQYRRMAETVGNAFDVDQLLPCDLADADIQCGHQFIVEFGLRAYRRPLTSTEITALREFFSRTVEEECFEQATRWVVTAMLQSPHFLYRTELGRRVEDGFELTAFEIASQLSYFLWRTMPDAELFERAADGSLLDAEVLREQTARLIHAPQSAIMMSEFAGKWLGTENLMHVVRDAVIYADLDLDLRQAMLEENRRLVTDLWRRDRPYAELFQAEHTWVNERLAAHYGFAFEATEADADGFQKVQVDETRPAGVLTQGAFLTTHASPTSSSPIMRGLTVRERLLCEELSLPAFAIPELPEDAGPNATTRERFAAHTENELCQSCHMFIDPLGFAFEHYDGIGRYREMDGAEPVDASGRLVRQDAEETPFHGVGELAQLLIDEPLAKRCFSRQWLRYGVGESEGLDVACQVDALTSALDERQGRLKSVALAMTRLPHFKRRSGGVSEQDVLGADLIPAMPGAEPRAVAPLAPPDDVFNPVCGEVPQMVERAVAGDPRIEIASREDRWEHGYCVYLTLTNISEVTLEGWEVRWEVEGTISNTWGAFRDTDAGSVTFINLPENARLEANQQAQLGFCATF